tara:strand:+ start:17859 stop:18062 length:204 start_codon:yes stop_codon:yes gene_type:complete
MDLDVKKYYMRNLEILFINKENEVSKTEWSRLFGITRPTFDRWLGGGIPSDDETLEKVKTVLKIASK